MLPAQAQKLIFKSYEPFNDNDLHAQATYERYKSIEKTAMAKAVAPVIERNPKLEPAARALFPRTIWVYDGEYEDDMAFLLEYAQAKLDAAKAQKKKDEAYAQSVSGHGPQPGGEFRSRRQR